MVNGATTAQSQSAPAREREKVYKDRVHPDDDEEYTDRFRNLITSISQ